MWTLIASRPSVTAPFSRQRGTPVPPCFSVVSLARRYWRRSPYPIVPAPPSKSSTLPAAISHWSDAEASPPVPVFGGVTPPLPALPLGVLVAGAVVGAAGAVFVASGSSVGTAVPCGVGVCVLGGPSVGVSHCAPNATSSGPGAAPPL